MAGILLRRFIVYLLGFSILLGIMYGGAVLLFENNHEALSTFKPVFAFHVLVAFALAYFHSDNKDALWTALENDHRPVEVKSDRMPMSGGLFGSSDLDDLCAAKSFADNNGVTLCRVKKRDAIGPCIEIPWDRIDSVEIVEPDKDLVEMVVAKGSRKAASALLTAKIHLKRKRSAMTLIVPWNEQFTRHAPPSVEIKKDWEWPFAVL